MSEVVKLFPIASRDCLGCGDAHGEPGTLCKSCRSRQSAVAPAFVANSVASVVADLERLNKQRYPLAEPIASVLNKTRRLYDMLGPRIQDAAPGEIHFMSGEFWGFPADADGVQLGPFGNAAAAEAALVKFAADKPVKP